MGADHNGTPAARGCMVSVTVVIPGKLGGQRLHSSRPKIAAWLRSRTIQIPKRLFSNGTQCYSGAVSRISQSSRLSAIPRAVMTPERRYLTVMFADLVGYTAMSERLDPEQLRDAQLWYQDLTRDVVERYGGFVAAYSGDGILAYFGYPTAHENDAERGVRAALEIVERVSKADLSESLSTPEKLSVRVALHTGLAVVGPEIASLGRAVQGAVGEAVNLAARLQAEAEPNTIVVSGATQELVDGLFDCQPLGLRPIRGLSRRISIYRVLGVRPGGGRALGRWRRGAVRMIGRQASLDRLMGQWQAVTGEGRCRAVQVIGEAGIGKSRLVLELCEALFLPDRQILQANCLEIFATTPLYPAAGFLWARTGIRAEDSQETKHRKIVAFLSERGLESGDAIDTLAGLLGVVLPDAAEGPHPPPAEVKRRQFALIIALIERIARDAPTLLWLEDVHWLDPSSAELLLQVIDRLRETPLLVVLTRRSFPSGPELPYPDDVIPLGHLPPSDCIELARAVPGAQALPERLLSEALASADGIPLFVEQLVLSLVILSGDPARLSLPPGPLVVPLSLTEILSERLDRLPGGRGIVQAAACIGRAFTPIFLAALLDQDESAVLEPLDALVGAEILRRQGEAGRVEFEFRHGLLRRVAYESILRTDRQAKHARIAALLKDGGDLGPVLPEVLAHHLTEAGAIEPAIEGWLAAGARAALRSAHLEALAHLGRGLALLDRVADATVQRNLEIKLQAARIGPITATGSASSAEMGACCHRGLELCLDGEPSPMAFPFLFGQFAFLIGRAQLAEALEVANRFLALAERAAYAPARVIGHRLVGMARFGLGDARGARDEAERSLQLYVAERDAADVHLFGQNAQVHGSALLSLVLFCLGETDTAFRAGITALRAADELRHPHSTAIAIAYVGGWVFGLSGAGDLLMQQARRLIRVSEQHQLTVFRHFGEAMLGWALCQQGVLNQGIAVLEQACAALTAAEWRVSEAGLVAILADAKRRSGMLEEARALSERALAAARTADRWLEPEALRVAGLVAAEADPGDPAAVRLLREGVACARQMGFPVFEARCLASLSVMADASERPEIEARLGELAQFVGMDQRLRQEMQGR
jgi:class 3 adenylate cyclase/tetratricopeptide (TPR) repeat protein